MDAINAINALYILIFLHQTATLSLSNRVAIRLYILIFLHQTATQIDKARSDIGCISLYSYIKPQLKFSVRSHLPSCISLYSYIKPQQRSSSSVMSVVVYPYIPTSNRNPRPRLLYLVALYILIFLHQTATMGAGWDWKVELYILIFLHQTATWGWYSSY